MSEFIDNQSRRKEALQRVIRQLHEGSSIDEVKAQFADLLQEVGASEIAEIEQALIDEGLPETEVKRLCDVHVAVFRESLDAQPSPETIPGHPIHTFRAENAAAAEVLNALEHALSALKAQPDQERTRFAASQLHQLRRYEKHYLRKENILFPYLERHGFMGPSSVMWAIHDDIRAGWKRLDEILSHGPGDDPATFAGQVEAVFAPLGTAIREMFYKEENILFPTALEKLDAEEWAAIRTQGSDIGYAYVQPEEMASDVGPLGRADVSEAQPAEAAGWLELDTGRLTPQEVNQLLGNLPLDITYVRDDDTVAFFSHGEERIFPRSAAIIGRSVQKCHPPASVHRVQQIVDDFRADRRDQAEFWIQTNGKFIHIRFFAVRDAQRAYQGTLEIVQDVTRIRSLEGERRLLDEED